MRATFHIFYNGESCKDVGLSVISRPTIPVPEREYDTIKVEGRDGELHRDSKDYLHIVRTYSPSWDYQANIKKDASG